MKQDSDKIRQALYDKALGYRCEEVTEEYGLVDSELKLLKRKCNTKVYPPDISAITMLLDKDKSELDSMSDEELEQEKQRLIKLLKKEK